MSKDNKKSRKLLTVGELKMHLENLPDEAEIFFGCEALEFYRACIQLINATFVRDILKK